MLNFLFSDPFSFVIWAVALLAAIAVHEAAHAWAAEQLGDPTAKLQGRLTLNPLAHLDPIGTLMILFFRFGWGKPVPIDEYNLRYPRRDAALISLAGPASNLILATILAVATRGIQGLQGLLEPIIILSVSLAIFNLIPIHPLDGGKILVGFLPHRLADDVENILQQYGLILMIMLVVPFWGGTSPAISLISPLINLILNLLLPGNIIT
ncbi:MAG: site-2 protease family protein [Candidatus Shapirobacteria bacterium]